MNIGVIGLGNIGTAIANLIATNGYPVTAWEYQQSVVHEVNNQHVNTRFLPDIPLSSNLVATHQLEEVLPSADVVFTALPSIFIRSTLEPYRDRLKPQAMVVNLAKGIDIQTGLTAFQTLTMLFPHHKTIMLSGPAIANEFARGSPTVVVIAGQSTTNLLAIAHLLDSDHFRVRFSADAIGVELGGILKNAYAIGLGMFDGKHIQSVNFRSVYFTIALEEMTRVGVSLGAQRETFFYLAGIGDLLATALSEHSHNRRMGELLAQGLNIPQITETMGVLPEGYNTIQMILAIAEKMHVPAPLAKGLWDVICGRSDAEQFIQAVIKDFVG